MSVQGDFNEVINDFLSMLENGTSNDVTILLEDGEMKANKDVLIARPIYFSSMLKDDNNYVESQSGVINLNYVKKAVMHGIVYYLFAGQIDFKTFNIEELVEMMTLTKMMSIDKLSLGIEDHLRSILGKEEMLLRDVLKGFVLAHRFNIDYMIEPFVNAIHKNLDYEMTVPLVFFEHLNVDVIKTLFLTVDDKAQTAATSQLRLLRFYVWYSRNSQLMKDEDKREILGTFDLAKFTEDQLLRIRNLGLFTNAEVDGSLIAIIKRLRNEKKEFQDWVIELEKKLCGKPNELKSDLLQRITRLKKDVADRRSSFDRPATKDL